jgi:uncharacterized coiled-coil protein SlyX
LPEAEALQTLSAQLRAARQKLEQQQGQLEQLEAWLKNMAWLMYVNVRCR